MRKFYKYMPINDNDRKKWIKESLEQQKIYLSHYSEMNDFFEYLTTNGRVENDRNSNCLEKSVFNLEDHDYQYIYSLSGEKHNEELMWAHYANKFNGIRITFELATNQIDSLYKLHEVEYHTYDKMDLVGIRSFPIGHKSVSWRYENEFRITSKVGGYRPIGLCNLSIAKVDIGMRVSHDFKGEITKICKNNSIPIDEFHPINIFKRK